MGVRHEDARKTRPVGRHSRGKTEHQEQYLRLQWRTFAADIMAVRLQNSNRRNDVRHYRLIEAIDAIDWRTK